jgi:hypothetical protein
MLKLRSTVKPELLRHKLFQGTFIGGAGALVILIEGTTFPRELLKIWGLPIMILGFLLISIGLLPYRRLTRLETKPHELTIDEHSVIFSRWGKPLLKIPLKSIEKSEYLERAHLYGLGIHLKQPVSKKIAILQPGFNISSFIAKSTTDFGCPFFFPYFSKHSCHELEELLTDNDE